MKNLRMPAGESEVRSKTKARFDEVLKRYANPPHQKKKSKQKEDQPQGNIVLQNLRKDLDLSKDTEDDETILSNTYDPTQGSPRFTKNRRREREATEKANNNNIANQGEPTLVRGKKKSKRELPPPPIQLEHHEDRNGHWSEDKVTEESDGGYKREVKREKSRREDSRIKGRETVKADDDLLQEYQQQLSKEEDRALKKTILKKQTDKMPPGGQQVVVLNNETAKKKKKKKLRSNEDNTDASTLSSEHRASHHEPAVEETEYKAKDQGYTTEGCKEDSVKPKGKKKKRQTEAMVVDSQMEAEAPLKQQSFDDSLVLGVYIHRTDRLKTDLLVSHPMVKVHVVEEVSGQYVKKEDSHRPVSSFYEQENIEHILPIMTQPFDFKKNKSTVPEWEEQIIFNERFGYFLQDDDERPQVILFFEVLDFISMEEARANVDAENYERGFRKVAWAFLKLVGTNGVLNIDSKLRLQLYCPPPRAKRVPHTLEVYEWWKKFPRHRYASTLYVTVKGLKLPEYVDPSIRSMMALQQERGSTSYSELHSEVTRRTTTQLLESKADIIKWSRMPGQVCRIPNKPMLSFHGGQMGCFTLRFSHDGRALAAACADRDSFPIVVYEIPSGKVLASFNGHLNIVYDLCWSRDSQRLLSASSDGTVRVWNIGRLQGLAQKILPHPSFVYCAQYHPQAQNLVVTGGYDNLLRVWNVDVRDVNGQLFHEFEGHKTLINALCFDSEGHRMFSADNAGLIIVWNTVVEDGSNQRPTHLWNIEKEIKEDDLNGIAISSMEVHPNGRRLLIHAKDSVLRVMDLRILAVKKFIGATNYRERIHSTFTPCGSFIFSGSEDGLAYVWNAETGDQVAVYSELCYPTALRGVAFHPHDNIVAFCAFGQSQPIHLYLFDRKVAQLEIENMRGLSRSETADSKAATSELMPFQDPAASGLDRFASAARVSLKMQRVKHKLDSVLGSTGNSDGVEYFYEQGSMSHMGRSLTLEGLVSLPPPSFLSPHSKLQLSSSLGSQLIPQAILTSQTGGFSPVGQSFKRAPSIKLQRSFPEQESALRVEADSLVQVQQMVVALYDYSANRSDELTVRRGDVIHVLYKDNDNWWFGRLGSGQQGYFPATYVADEKGFDEELSRATEAQPTPTEQTVDRATPTKLSAAISATGELKILSEQDTDPEASLTRAKKKKKKVRRGEVPHDLLHTPPSDLESRATPGRRQRPLPRLGQANDALQPHGLTQDKG